ncbi:peptidoglycan recognition protein family protein [Paraburkholderia phenoliruptrix]|uniref:N-acetylmuramoyl-L-alanine amidase family 2 n=3 Tax=Paraburkholderia phenoliruptrix TaxID=252970 RepID=K0DL98_9BURK|nr:N-acetylmuramoyl-L-alanine amidase [Paraburkholderia phenoliruptrix]AFT86876.1 N-acetylmuramoyl-L-alanine amidase family 2 [Paraburkholderia phenoliruptrix BR3459a]MDR6389661.1 hypothetical protein [Paraburkholderia phenoliruptrix]
MADYAIEHWTIGQTVPNGENASAISLSVNNRAATRQAIINALAKKGYSLIERSRWHAHPPKTGVRESRWDYQDIVIHHAGRSYSCGAPSMEQIQRAQSEDMARSHPFDDIGYHYAVSCEGEIYEGRDIRFIGEHVDKNNTGKVGIVLLADLVQAGEAYQHEYKDMSLIDKLKHLKDIMADQVVVDHDKLTASQTKAVEVLCGVLKDFFNISCLGGHREYQMLATHTGRACPGSLGMGLVKSLRTTLGLSAPLK